MKKFFLLIALGLLTVGASAQHYGSYGHQRQQIPRHQQVPHHQGPSRQGARIHGPAYGHNLRPEVVCASDWQRLWNGCHVRLKGGKVYVYERDGDRVVYGDEIILLPNGYYKVRKGADWRIYERDGHWTSIHGSRIVSLWNGCYTVLVGDVWRVFEEDGDRLSIWSMRPVRMHSK